MYSFQSLRKNCIQQNHELFRKVIYQTSVYGFLPGRSTLQQLLLFTEKLLEAKSVHGEVDVIYMDFRKALDFVSHDGLLLKLKSVGITGKLWSWLQTYLKYHSQCVRIGTSTSEYCDVLSGVPQGSVLGPLLL